MTCGVYLITNTVTGDTYVGRATNIEGRFAYGHISKLKKGAHSNKRMTDLFNQTGEEAFVLTVLEECTKFHSVFAEERWIEKLNPTINVSRKEISEIRSRCGKLSWKNRRPA